MIISRIKKTDKHIRRCIALIVILAIYIVFVSYMTFKIHSPLPFACVEEIITVAVFIAVFVVIAIARAIYIRKKEKK